MIDINATFSYVPSKMNVESLYKKAIKDLWDDSIDSLPEGLGKEIAKRGYAVEQDLPHDDVLFVGMNPAYDERREHPGVRIYNVADKGNAFFKAIVDFSERTREYSNPSHHDLLFVRHTNQKDVEAILKNGPFKGFLQKQLDISMEIIRSLSPKLIVVLNAGACKLFDSMFTRVSDEHIQKDLGAYPFLINEVTPVLFSSMLSGQRALDRGSRNSLSWHINFILNNLR